MCRQVSEEHVPDILFGYCFSFYYKFKESSHKWVMHKLVFVDLEKYFVYSLMICQAKIEVWADQRVRGRASRSGQGQGGEPG